MNIDHYSAAVSAAKKGKLQVAINHLNLCLLIDPAHAEAFLLRGNCKANMKNLKGAIEDFDNAIAKGFRHAEVFYTRGRVKLDLGWHEQAVADFDQTISQNPDHHFALYNRGTAKIYLEDFAGAISDLDKAILLEPTNAEAFRNRGVARFKLENLTAAIADLDKAIGIDPDRAEYFMCRSALHEKNGDTKASMTDRKHAFMLDPSTADTSRSKRKAVFKYYDSQFHDSWKKGRIMVSARDPLKELYQAGPVSDPSEGKVNYFIDEIDSKNPEQMAAGAKLGLTSTPEHPASGENQFGNSMLFVNKSRDFQINLKNVSLPNVQLENTHIFCTALRRDDARWAEVTKKQGGPYNSVLKITDFHEFCRRVYVELDKVVPLNFIEIADCEYTGNWETFPDTPVDHFKKPPDLAWQTEKKAIFLPKDDKAELKGQIVEINVADLVEFLEFGVH